MNTESLLPFLLLFTPFLIAIFLEAVVIYFFRLSSFWISIGESLVLNLISTALIYVVGTKLLSTIGYELEGLKFDLRVVMFFCWLSIIAEGLVLKFLLKKKEAKTVFLAAIVMNTLSYLFLYFFIEHSH